MWDYTFPFKIFSAFKHFFFKASPVACNLFRAESSSYLVFLQHLAQDLSMLCVSSRRIPSFRSSSLLRALWGVKANFLSSRDWHLCLDCNPYRKLHFIYLMLWLTSSGHAGLGLAWSWLLCWWNHTCLSVQRWPNQALKTRLHHAAIWSHGSSASIFYGNRHRLCWQRESMQSFVQVEKNITFVYFVFASFESYSSQPCSLLYYK